MIHKLDEAHVCHREITRDLNMKLWTMILNIFRKSYCVLPISVIKWFTWLVSVLQWSRSEFNLPVAHSIFLGIDYILWSRQHLWNCGVFLLKCWRKLYSATVVVLTWIHSCKESLKIPALIFFFPRWLSGKESICQCRKHKRCEFNSWVRKIPWRRKF